MDKCCDSCGLEFTFPAQINVEYKTETVVRFHNFYIDDSEI